MSEGNSILQPSQTQGIALGADGHFASCWCKQGSWVRVFRTSRFGLLRCSSCGCYRIDPPPLQHDNEGRDFYTDYYSQAVKDVKYVKDVKDVVPGKRSSRFWQVARKTTVLTKVGETVLDIGCGEGTLCGELLAAGWQRVIGIDVSSSRIGRARALRSGIEFYDANIDKIEKISKRSLDLVILDNVIEHLPRPLEFLQRTRPYLKKGGRMVTITPNMGSGHFLVLGRRWTPELAPHVHIFLQTESSLRSLVRAGGFSLKTSGSFHTPLSSLKASFQEIRSGNLKRLIWRNCQDLGGLVGRLINRGAMIYAIAGAGDEKSWRD